MLNMNNCIVSGNSGVPAITNGGAANIGTTAFIGNTDGDISGGFNDLGGSCERVRAGGTGRARGGLLYAWDVEQNRTVCDEESLQNRGFTSSGKTSSGVRRWWRAAIARDLSHIAYWDGGAEAGRSERHELCVLRRADNTVKGYPSIEPRNPGPVAFHPTRPLLATLNDNGLLAALDYESGRVLVEKGPQAHSVSFSLGASVLYDDWYAVTQRFDYETLEHHKVATGWGSQGSQSDRFVTADAGGFSVFSLARGPRGRRTEFDKIEECLLSDEGTRLLVWADLLCVWDLGAP